jgi:hypothetical protein
MTYNQTSKHPKTLEIDINLGPYNKLEITITVLVIDNVVDNQHILPNNITLIELVFPISIFQILII